MTGKRFSAAKALVFAAFLLRGLGGFVGGVSFGV